MAEFHEGFLAGAHEERRVFLVRSGFYLDVEALAVGREGQQIKAEAGIKRVVRIDCVLVRCARELPALFCQHQLLAAKAVVQPLELTAPQLALGSVVEHRRGMQTGEREVQTVMDDRVQRNAQMGGQRPELTELNAVFLSLQLPHVDHLQPAGVGELLLGETVMHSQKSDDVFCGCNGAVFLRPWHTTLPQPRSPERRQRR